MLYKSLDKWTEKQKTRDSILFREYPDIEQTYLLTQQLRNIFNLDYQKNITRTKLVKQYNDVEKSRFKAFNILSKMLQNNYETILNDFNNRNTNTSSKCFNAKIKVLEHNLEV